MRASIAVILILLFNSCSTKKVVEGPQYFTTADSVKLMFVEKGAADKTPIIFLQGSDGTSFEWQLFSERLKDKYHLILFDRRGMGLSSRMLPERKINMKLYLQDIAALQQHLNIDKAVVLGWSFGGAVAQEYAMQYPNKVSQLILVNPLSDAQQLWIDRAEAVYPFAVEAKDTLALQVIEKLKKAEHLTIEDEYELVKVHNVACYSAAAIDSFYAYANYKAFGYTDSTINTDWENLIAQKKIYDRYTTLGRIASINCPTLIIAGTHDHVISVKQCEKIHSQIKGSILSVFNNCGHMPFIESPDELEKTIRGFVK